VDLRLAPLRRDPQDMRGYSTCGSPPCSVAAPIRRTWLLLHLWISALLRCSADPQDMPWAEARARGVARV